MTGSRGDVAQLAASLLVAVAFACNSSSSQRPAPDAVVKDISSSVPADAQAAGSLTRPILSFDTATVESANLANLPPGFTTPQETVCAADITRAFLGEFVDHDVSDIQVNYEWSPTVPGSLPDKVTVGQPEFFLAGEAAAWNLSTSDVAFAHPSGLDFNVDIKTDPEFALLVHNRPGNPNGTDTIHTELESGLFPQVAFGYAPAVGDRVLLKGAWIYDCGHPPYETELRPPTFVAYARPADPQTTIALAFVNPFRESQLYNANADLAVDFANADRFTDPNSLPFPKHFLSQVYGVAGGNVARLSAHGLIEATAFDTLTWSVCAPLPRPPGSVLDSSYRFTARTGVDVQAAPDDASGCVQFTAVMSSSYTPMAQTRSDVVWSWEEVSQEASDQAGKTIDIRQKIIDQFTALGFTGDYPALHDDNPPLIDGYPPLQARGDAAMDAPTNIDTRADDQPFPFYGRARVFWRAN